jgi:hypothetical protein
VSKGASQIKIDLLGTSERLAKYDYPRALKSGGNLLFARVTGCGGAGRAGTN